MKYKTYELLKGISSLDQFEREQSIKILHSNQMEYRIVFGKVKEKLSRNFLAKYIKHEAFHDFEILEVLISNKLKKPMSASITISDREKQFRIEYIEINDLSINFIEEIESKCFLGLDRWEDDEFLEIGKNVLSHEIITSRGFSILICFKRIRITEIKTNEMSQYE